jgi:hypothetical protein
MINYSSPGNGAIKACMKIGDEVYYKYHDGTFIKVKLTDVSVRHCFDGEIELNGAKVKLRDIPYTKLVEENVYQSQLFKNLTEIEGAK